MRIIDTKQGKIFGINFVDLVVLGIVLFLGFSFITQIVQRDLVFDGDEMYSAIRTYQKLDSKGFLIETEIKGKRIPDESTFYAKGIITETKSGSFVIKTEDGSALRIGGSMAYLEDIAASEIVFKPIDRYVVSFNLGSTSFSSYSEFLDYFRNIAIKIGSDHLAIKTDISFVNPTPSSSQEIFSAFNGLYLLKYAGIVQTKEGETILKLDLAELSELEKLNINADKVIIGKTTVYAGFMTKPPAELNIDMDYHVFSLEDLK